MAWLRAVAGFQVFRGGRFWVFGDTLIPTDHDQREEGAPSALCGWRPFFKPFAINHLDPRQRFLPIRDRFSYCFASVISAGEDTVGVHAVWRKWITSIASAAHEDLQAEQRIHGGNRSGSR